MFRAGRIFGIRAVKLQTNPTETWQTEPFQELRPSPNLTVVSLEQEKAYSELFSNFQTGGPNATVLEFIQERAVDLVVFNTSKGYSCSLLLIDTKV